MGKRVVSTCQFLVSREGVRIIIRFYRVCQIRDLGKIAAYRAQGAQGAQIFQSNPRATGFVQI